MKSKIIGLFWVFFAALSAIYFTDGIFFLVKYIPPKYEKKWGDEWNKYYQRSICLNPNGKSQLAFAKLLNRIYPIEGLDNLDEMKIEFNIVKNSEANAFATLGGKIYLNSGLLKEAKSPEEIAGILAHEIAHVKERHVLQGVFMKIMFPTKNQGDIFINLGFSKSEEALADYLGLERLKLAKINAQGFYDFFDRKNSFSNEMISLLSDHPGDQSRKVMAQKYLKFPHLEILDQSEWEDLKQFCN